MWYSESRPLWLAPLSGLYGAVMAFRSLLYRLGLRHRVKVGVPVVVIGNLTVGGTGKTPLVAWLASRLSAVGLRVAIVSRGYGGRARGVTRVTMHSRPSEVGDEPLLRRWRAMRTPRCSSAATGSRRPKPRWPTAPTSWYPTMGSSISRWCAIARSW